MIPFETKYGDIYNKIIHNFLDVSFYKGKNEQSSKNDKGDFLDVFLPSYLRREQYQACMKALEDLYYWTDDQIKHDITSLHQLILYYFIEMMESKKKTTRSFNTTFFNNQNKIEIECIVNKGLLFNDEISIKKEIEKFYNLHSYKKILFKNLDFILISQKLQQGLITGYEEISYGDQLIYFHILPLSIQKQIKINSINIMELISEFLEFVHYKLVNGNFIDLFWVNNEAVKEDRIQVILYNLMDAYFYKKNINISREPLVGHGRIDFTCYINQKERLLIEIKKASNTKLNVGFKEQLFQYMNSYQCKKAIYLIFCFNDKEIAKANKLKKHFESKLINSTDIKIILFDARKSSKELIFRNESKKSRENPYIIDEYFKKLLQCVEIRNHEDAIEFLNQTINNYAQLGNDKLKKEYHSYLMSIIFNTEEEVRRNFNFRSSFLFPNDFYQIFDSEEVYKLFLFRILTILKCDEQWENELKKLITFYTFCKNANDRNLLNPNEIDEIFRVIISKKADVYCFFLELHIDIYVFDNISVIIDYIILEHENNKQFLLSKFNPVHIHEYLSKINPIISFYEQLSIILFLKIVDENKEILKDYMKHMNMTPDLRNEDIAQIFISDLTLYLMYETKYEEYNGRILALDVKSKEINSFFEEFFHCYKKEKL